MKVSVERYIEQVYDGSHYKGYVKIADTTFDYELKFAVPIPRLDDMEMTEDEDEIRHLFQISIVRDGANIELTGEEYGFFFQMLVQFAVAFCKNPQVRDSQEGAVGMILRGEGPLAASRVSASIGITSIGSYNFPPELCEMLNAPKFGCALIA